MLSSDVGQLSMLGMTMSSVIMIFVLLPVTIFLYLRNQDRVLRILFGGMAVGFGLLSLSGILSYLLPMVIDVSWTSQVSTLIMLTSYVPTLIALGLVLWGARDKLNLYQTAFITFIDAALAISIVFVAATNFHRGLAFETIVYTTSVIFDIAVFALSAILILIYLPTKYRYIVSIIFTYNIMSFMGDSINLMALLGIYDITQYSDIFYICTLTFAATAVLLYALGDIKPVTVEEINKKYNDARRLMSDIVALSPIGTCICDTKGNILSVNESFLTIFNKKESDVVGKVTVFELALNISDALVSALQRMLKGEMVVEDSVRIGHGGAEDKYIAVKMFSTQDTEGVRTSYVIMADDVTARIQAEKELIEARDQAELYIDLMGHDIDNMNKIGMGYLEMAMGQLDLQEEQRALLTKPLEVMSSSTMLIDNVRKMQATMNGNGNLERVDLESVLTSIVKNYRVVTGRDFLIKYDTVEKCYVMADDLLKDVFLNILNNAVRYSSGALLVHVELAPVFQFGEKYYRITLEDNGPGIPDETKPYIFDLAYRSRIKMDYGSLGLYLAKTLVDKYHGMIGVEDRVPGDRKQGSRFIVTLPAAP